MRCVAATPVSSSATHTHTALPLVDNFLQVLPPERSHSAAPAVSAIQRSAAAVRVASSVKPSRGAIVTETVKKAAYALSNSCLQLEQLVLDVGDGQSAQNSCRTDASMSSRRCAADRVVLMSPPKHLAVPPQAAFSLQAFPDLTNPLETCILPTALAIAAVRPRCLDRSRNLCRPPPQTSSCRFALLPHFCKHSRLPTRRSLNRSSRRYHLTSFKAFKV